MLKCALVCTVSMGERTLPASVLEGRNEPDVRQTLFSGQKKVAESS